jgi:protein-tyrosine phosphatase
MSTVLFICTGNLCRSPTASALLASRLASADSDICVDSAGLLDLGAQSPPEVITAGLPLGVDLSGHRGRQVTPADIRGADLILGMTRGHVREVVTMDPGAWSRTFTLSEIVRRGRAVGPRGVGQSLDECVTTAHKTAPCE